METSVRPTKTKRDPDPASPAVVLTYADLEAIGQLLSRNIPVTDTATIKAELYQRIADLSIISVEGVPVKLEPKLLFRLKTRCLDKGNFPKWLTEVVIKQLHDYAGY